MRSRVNKAYTFKLDAGESAGGDCTLQVVQLAYGGRVIELGGAGIAHVLKGFTVDGVEIEHEAMMDKLENGGPCKIVLTLSGELAEVRQLV